MKITLTDLEFNKMAEAWVHENFVDKILAEAEILDNVITLQVIGEGDIPEPAEEVEEPTTYTAEDRLL